jgi:hypothetical protein
VIEWYATVVIIIAATVGLASVILGLAGRFPSDYTLGATAVVEVLLIGQLALAIVAPLTGNSPTGSLIEFWVYLISAILIPPAAVLWALVERSKWSTVILGLACLAIAVMVYRMTQIWFVQVA